MSAGRTARGAAGRRRRGAGAGRRPSFDRPLVLEAGAGTGKTATLVARIVAWCLGPGWRRAAAELARAAAALGEGRGGGRRDGSRRGCWTAWSRSPSPRRRPPRWRAGWRRRSPRLARWAAPRGCCPRRSPARTARSGSGRGAAGGARPSRGRHDPRVLPAPARPRPARGRAPPVVRRGRRRRGPRGGRAGDRRGGVPCRAGPAPRKGRSSPWRCVASARRSWRLRSSTWRMPACRRRRSPRPARAPRRSRRWRRRCARGGCGRRARRSRVGRRGRSPTQADRERLRDPRAGEPRARSRRWLRRWRAPCRRTWPRRLRNGATGREGGETEVLATWPPSCVSRPAASAPSRATSPSLYPGCLRPARRGLVPLLGAARAPMRSHGAVTFAALLRDARDLLVGAPTSAAGARRGSTQLLVDEFQDTDPLQCDVLRLLALDGEAGASRGCSWSATRKQSIYGWRNADLAAYDGFLDVVRRCGGEVTGLVGQLPLGAAILAEVRRVVAPVMVREERRAAAVPAAAPEPGRRGATGSATAGTARSSTGCRGRGGRGAEGFAQHRAAAESRRVARGRPPRAAPRTGVSWGRSVCCCAPRRRSRRTSRRCARPACPTSSSATARTTGGARSSRPRHSSARSSTPAITSRWSPCCARALVGVPDAALLPLWTRSSPAASELDDTERGRTGSRSRRSCREAAGRGAGRSPARSRPGLGATPGRGPGTARRLRRSFAATRRGVRRAAASRDARRGDRGGPVPRARTGRANLDRFFRDAAGGDRGRAATAGGAARVAASVAEAREAEEGRPLAAAEDAVRVMTIHKAKGLDFDHVYLLQADRRASGDARAGRRPRRCGRPLRATACSGARPPAGTASRSERRVGAPSGPHAVRRDDAGEGTARSGGELAGGARGGGPVELARRAPGPAGDVRGPRRRVVVLAGGGRHATGTARAGCSQRSARGGRRRRDRGDDPALAAPGRSSATRTGSRGCARRPRRA